MKNQKYLLFSPLQKHPLTAASGTESKVQGLFLFTFVMCFGGRGGSLCTSIVACIFLFDSTCCCAIAVIFKIADSPTVPLCLSNKRVLRTYLMPGIVLSLGDTAINANNKCCFLFLWDLQSRSNVANSHLGSRLTV